MKNLSKSQSWIEQIFNASQARSGGIVRRNVRSVRRFASETNLKAAVEAKKFHMVLCGRQYVIFCGQSDLRIIV